MPFRNLVSWTGTGGVQSHEPDQDSGLWRNSRPSGPLLAVTTYTITSEDVMRGSIFNTAACTYTMPSAAHLLADYPDWPIGGSVTFGVFAGGATVASKGFSNGIATSLAYGSAAAAVGACFVTLWRDSDTTFKYALMRSTL